MHAAREIAERGLRDVHLHVWLGDGTGRGKVRLAGSIAAGRLGHVQPGGAAVGDELEEETKALLDARELAFMDDFDGDHDRAVVCELTHVESGGLGLGFGCDEPFRYCWQVGLGASWEESGHGRLECISAKGF